MMFAQGSFTNSANATPEQIAQKRAYIAALMPKFGDASYVGEGLGQLATGVMVGRQNKKLNAQEAAGRKSAEELFAGIVGRGSAAPGSFGVLGAAPMADMPPPDPNSPHALGNDAMAALGKPAVSTAADPQSIKAGLVARGLPEHVAEGFVMNMKDESGLNPGINEIAPLVPGSRGGFGLYQLTGPRRRAYEAFAAERGVPVDDVDAQLDFLMMEMQGPEANAAQAILSTKTPGEAGAAIVNKFLRPSPEYAARRAANYLGGAQPVAPQVPDDQLAAALANPWLSPEERGMLSTMYEQQVQASDPLRQLELQKAQIELDQLQNPQQQPPEDFTNRMFMLNSLGIDPQSEEGQTYILTGKLPEAPKPGYRQMTPEEIAANPRLDPTKAYQISPEGKVELVGGGGTSVSVDLGGGGPELGKLSTDYGYILGPDGKPKIDPATGLPMAAPVPGSPAAIEQERIAAASAASGGADVVATDTITTAAQRARAAAGNREMGGVGAGLVAAVNPYSDSAEVERQIDVLRANAATTTLQAMRDASPTGSTGLGALTAPEMKVIQDKVGALNQNSPTFLRDLEDYERTLLRTIHGPEAGDRIYEETRQNSAQPAASPDGWITLPNGVRVREVK